MRIIFFFIFILTAGITSGQILPEKPIEKYSISGNITDSHGESLIGANIYVSELNSGTSSNNYGFYSLTLPGGIHNITYSYIGFNTETKQVTLNKDLVCNIKLSLVRENLDGVEIIAEPMQNQIQITDLNSYKIPAPVVNEIPVLLGEPDILKVIQLLPGVQAPGEGLSGLVVRGGNTDQNLFLLDEAPVYNASHLMGFFSVFNNQAINDVTFYKGYMPSIYGGRLSSLLDVRMKEGNYNRFSSSGGIGTISSKLTLESPILKQKGSFLVSGRRSYADIFLPLSDNEEVKNNHLYFYDLNLKMNYRLNPRNKIYLSTYHGRDVFKFRNKYYLTWGNLTQTFRWNHVFSGKLFSNLSAIYSKYDYRLGQTVDIAGIEWNSSLEDISLKYDFTFYHNPNSTIRFGVASCLHSFKPGFIKATDPSSIFNNFTIPGSQALDHALYFDHNFTLTTRFTLNYGLRFTFFQNMGKAVIYNFDENYEKTDSTVYGNGEIFNSFAGIEPRISLNYLISQGNSIRGSYTRTKQYMHLLSNASTGTPLDIWIPSNPNIEPQLADQAVLGFFKTLDEAGLEFSTELFYKWMKDQVDYKEHADLILNPEVEGQLRFGKATSYGLELMINKTKGKFNGWISYTLSKAEKEFTDLNNGNPFPSNFDRRHNVSVNLNYNINERMRFSVNWIYLSGSPLTLPVGRYIYGNMIVPLYSARNTYRMPDYHRLDLGFILRGKQKPDRKISGEWSFSVYNAYNRKNAWMIYFQTDEENNMVTEAVKMYLFPIIPSISYNFKF